ncbi:protein phosphatase 2C domain-containing protein [Pelomonas sp. SE-A7]|uniref:PP2C family protein-serine/threonine phosphatase n=1 Tax=Pelomonas sp. SE-A7 TaxID=3054953 RepID=UPI00259D1871|nr:protein phosphatase 2C domain-containing protein [Pelomonas sp. SE-A7]MDM4767084.1 protein phosphatase 2C domain-containing protein [Pelomonas sp. SE-A7]
MWAPSMYAEATPRVDRAQRLRLRAAMALHQGDRAEQQDQVTLLRHSRMPGCLLAVVSDGMGGHSGGRQAADQVMLTAAELFDQFEPGQEDGRRFLERLCHESHKRMRQVGVEQDLQPHATIAACLLTPDLQAHWAHCGDSRLYRFHHGDLLRRSRDHSLVQRMIDDGELDELSARRHRHGHVLTDCLGSSVPPQPACVSLGRLAAGDVILVCSDGLWPYATDHELGAVADSRSAAEACSLLTGLARQRAGGRGDNLSMAVIRVEAIE